MPDSVRDTTTMATKFLVVIAFTWLVVRVYGSIHRGIFEPYARKAEASIDLHLFAVARTIINVLVWVVGITSGLNSIGFEVSAILAGIGIGGMAIALAAQDSVANIFGGLIILTQRPFKIGERIEVAGVDGWVHHIGLRSTIIKKLVRASRPRPQ